MFPHFLGENPKAQGPDPQQVSATLSFFAFGASAGTQGTGISPRSPPVADVLPMKRW